MPGSEEPELQQERQALRVKELEGELQYLNQLPDAYQLEPKELALVSQLQRSARAELLLRQKGSTLQTNQSEGAGLSTSMAQDTSSSTASKPRPTSSRPLETPRSSTRTSGTRRTRA